MHATKSISKEQGTGKTSTPSGKGSTKYSSVQSKYLVLTLI